MRTFLLAAIPLVLSLQSAAEDSAFPGVEKLMSAEQFEAAGLDKLNDKEKQALDSWLIEYTAFEAPQMRRDNEEVKQVEQELKIQSRIVPPFTGWDGKTIFTLENGQVWRQRLSGRFAYNGESRDVVIQKNFLGYFKMTHVASDTTIGVTRLE